MSKAGPPGGVGLRRRFAELGEVSRIAASVADGPTTVGGLVGSAPSLLLAALAHEHAQFPSVVLVVTAGQDEARAVAIDLRHFVDSTTQVSVLPPFDRVRTKARVRESDVLSARAERVAEIAHGTGQRIVVASLKAVLQPVPPPALLERASVSLRMGMNLDVNDLGARLEKAGFSRVPLTEAPGEWSRRGGIVDVFPRGRAAPIRIELFGDEIDSLRRFDPLTQRSIELVSDCVIPVLDAGDAVGLPDTDDPALLKRAIKKASLITDLLPANAVIAHVEEAAAAQWLARFESSRPEEELGTLYARFALGGLKHRALRLTSLPVTPGEHAHGLRLLSVTSLARDLVTFGAAVDALLESNDEVQLLCPSEGEETRIRTLLGEAGLAGEGRLRVSTGRLTHGFQMPSLRTAVLCYDELFGRTRLPVLGKRRKPLSTTAEWTDLRIGDPIVHLDHGVGIYRGLEERVKEGRSTDHLKIEFASATLLYVPVTKASLVHRYVGAGEAKPKLSKIGGKEWAKRKEAVSRSVAGTAQELLQTQALRAARPGIASSPDTPEQLEFEATFPFVLTEDQESALAATKADMEKDAPMDRLICGDVGFGKTELAVRAAFKTVMAGRQVAVLVPTTVLAEQHGHVFAERFAGYPLNVAVLSRFRSKGEQREIMARCADGGVDVVIGTHRLASGDIAFLDLGLLVIDEEQRFGVRAKEALRRYRAEVDCLTLTATPIPRTLHMALLGLRDISSLTVAPEGRRAIETRVVTPDDPRIREALLRELERGGQAYVIHNRVKSIEAVAGKLRHLVPEARCCVVHGQLTDSLIEQRMLEFVDHQADILIATTIVESGLDIPNANTMIIDRAELLGLADLHQLRGRVGRSLRRAYCFLVVAPGTLANDAERRVRAVEEHSDLGAGFRIAMRDLEIRGAGNLLGSEQSGHIASVGYELYCTLLADAVKRVRKERIPFRTSCYVNLPVDAALPASYVPDDRQRIQCYRRFSHAQDRSEVEGVVEDARDRFGPPPEQLELLAKLARIRIEGERLGVTRMAFILHDGEERVLLRCVEPHRVKNALADLGTRLRVIDRRHCHLLLPAQGLVDGDLADAILDMVDRAPGSSRPA